ncbi:MAG: hypothetical protein FWD53_05635, partial [Phycisphaerales bacterium]|nr:hypothetical protein [Phycisphaerales bacterium]
KVGKTTLLLYLAMRFALMGIPILFLDTEMSGEEVASRELSNVAVLDEHRLLASKYLDDGNEVASVQSAIAAIKGAPFFYTSIAGKRPEFALSMMRQFRNRHVGTQTIMVNGRELAITGKCAVFYDWLRLPAGMMADAKEYQLLGELCTALKDGARALHLPVIAGAQQNRAAIGVKDEADHIDNAEATVSGSDRLAMFCSALCILRNPSLAMQNAIDSNPLFAKKRPGEDSQTWLFNQIFQIVFQRQGREYRYGIPFYLDRGRARYEEVGTKDAMNFLKQYVTGRKVEAQETPLGHLAANSPPDSSPKTTTTHPPAHTRRRKK